MRALRVHALGGPPALQLDESPEPVPGAGQVLVRVRSAGVSFADVLMTEGRYQSQPPLPFAPGIDVAGTLEADLPGTGLATGDPVVAFCGWGGFAELVAAPAHFVCPLPDGLDWHEGAALMLNYQTAYFGLVWRGRLVAGETAVIHGAAGGVGTAACQVAAGLGARVIAVVSDEVRAAVARDAGASETVLVSEDWLGRIADLTGGRGAELVLDPVGGERFGLSLRALAPRGRILTVGFADGAIPKVALHRVLNRNADVVGVAWPPYGEVDRTMPRQIGDALAKLVAIGAVRPPIGSVRPLADGARALEDLQARRATGKIVLEVA